MDRYTNDEGEEVIIAEMENNRLIHAIAKYAKKLGIAEAMADDPGELEALVKALKAEALKRLAS